METGVRDALEARFGVDKLWQLEQLARHTWRAWLTDGGIVLAMILTDGTFKIWKVEEG